MTSCYTVYSTWWSNLKAVNNNNNENNNTGSYNKKIRLALYL